MVIFWNFIFIFILVCFTTIIEKKQKFVKNSVLQR